MKPSIFKSMLISASLLFLPDCIHARNSENWTGFYVGPKIGGVFNNASLNAKQLGLLDPSGTCITNPHFSSFFPGVQLGYARQLDSNFVIGVEGDFTQNTTKTVNSSCVCEPAPEIADYFSFRNRNQGSIRGRVGYALNKGQGFLPFLMGGGSFADLGLTYTNEGGDYYRKTSTKAGWLAGGGMSYLFSNNFSVGIEYFYAKYDDINLRIPNVYELIDPNGNIRGKLHTNNVAATLNYWFYG